MTFSRFQKQFGQLAKAIYLISDNTVIFTFRAHWEKGLQSSVKGGRKRIQVWFYGIMLKKWWINLVEAGHWEPKEHPID